MSANVILLILIIAHLLFWAIVVVRILVSRKRILTGQKTGQPGAGQPERSVSTGKRSQGLILLWALAICLIAYYLLLLLWASEPRRAGILLLPESNLAGGIGIVLIITGLALITWAYLRLHSFKLIATIQPDHQLCVEGPYSRIRHPVYSGMSLFYLGSFFLAPRSGILILTLCIILIGHLRSLMEERALASAFGDRYTEYMLHTYRYIPWLC
ncbi:MAG TPA: isoprenylcysteine carboxylmethyltransferase family protein [Puia sp.]|nr:isoprenylcysteine carboxylmethyltransferase family protein [Puia sp.]